MADGGALAGRFIRAGAADLTPPEPIDIEGAYVADSLAWIQRALRFLGDAISLRVHPGPRP